MTSTLRYCDVTVSLCSKFTSLFLDYDVIIFDDANFWGIVTSLRPCAPVCEPPSYTTSFKSAILRLRVHMRWNTIPRGK